MTQFLPVAVLLGLAACDGGQSGENSYEPCEGIFYEDVDAADVSLGFSASEVIAAAPLPVGVQWTELHLEPDGERIGVGGPTPVTDTLSMSNLAIVGEVRVADLSETDPACTARAGGDQQLVFPLAVEVSIGEGAATATGTMELWASGPDAARVTVNATRDLSVELADDYEVAFDAWWADKRAAFPDATGWVLEGVFVVPYGTLEALELDIEALYESSNSSSASALWRGEAVYAE